MLLKTGVSLVGDLGGAASPAPTAMCTWEDVDFNGNVVANETGDTSSGIGVDFNGTTDVTLIQAIGSDPDDAEIRFRRVRSVDIYNADNAAATVTIWLDDGSNERVVFKAELATLETAHYTPESGWRVLTTAGSVKQTAAITAASLSRGTIWAGNSSGVAAELDGGAAGGFFVSDGNDMVRVAMSGDATMDGAGAVTIANDSVTAAMLGSTAGGGSGIIYKGTNTANAVTELNVPIGNVVVGTTNDVTVLDMGAAAGNIMVDSGTAPASVAVSGDATLAANGALTIANDAVGVAKMGSTVAGSDGCIFKSTSTPNAVTELDVPVGNIIVGTSGDVGLLDMGASAGNIMVDSGTAPASVAVSGDATLAANGALTVQNLLGDNLANVSDGEVLGGIPVLFRKACTGGATANFDITITNKMRVIDFWVILKGLGTAGDTAQLFNGANAISDAVDCNVADQSIARAGTLDDARYEIAASGTMRITVTDGGGADVPAMEACVLCLPVA